MALYHIEIIGELECDEIAHGFIMVGGTLDRRYMSISQKIIDYAIWYYLRYYPSQRKLSSILTEKFGPNSEK